MPAPAGFRLHDSWLTVATMEASTDNCRFTISGAGCCLLDYIYADVDFTAAPFRACQSKHQGDGGLEPGKLTFAEEFQAFTGRDLETVLQEITQGQPVSAVNIGGPSIVSLIHAAQVLDPARFDVRFVGAVGADDEESDSGAARELRRQLVSTPLSAQGLVTKSGRTPRTVVLSDPRYDNGRGERSFLNTIGAAGQLTEDDLGADFYQAGLITFGGTAVVPQLHDALDRALARARTGGAFTVVNTVYDFRHQRQNPNARWPLGSSDECYRLIDLLIADGEEALRLAGSENLDDALAFFIAQGVGAVVVTNGSHDVALSIGSARYESCARKRFPVSEAIVAELAAHPERNRDTTGCGDNFTGGVIAEVARQLESGRPRVDLAAAIACGAVSGGMACFQFGGVFYEAWPGQKKELMAPYLKAYPR